MLTNLPMSRLTGSLPQLETICIQKGTAENFASMRVEIMRQYLSYTYFYRLCINIYHQQEILMDRHTRSLQKICTIIVSKPKRSRKFERNKFGVFTAPALYGDRHDVRHTYAVQRWRPILSD